MGSGRWSRCFRARPLPLRFEPVLLDDLQLVLVALTIALVAQPFIVLLVFKLPPFADGRDKDSRIDSLRSLVYFDGIRASRLRVEALACVMLESMVREIVDAGDDLRLF